VSATSELCFHFLRVVDGVPVLRDGVTPAPPVGEWLEYTGPLVCCRSGLHASRRAIDALSYYNWENGVVCLVEVDGIGGEENDKIVCSRRRIVAMVEADELLRLFARAARDAAWDATNDLLESMLLGEMGP